MKKNESPPFSLALTYLHLAQRIDPSIFWLKKPFESAWDYSPTKILHETIDILISKSALFLPSIAFEMYCHNHKNAQSQKKSSIDMLSKGNLFSTIKEKTHEAVSQDQLY